MNRLLCGMLIGCGLAALSGCGYQKHLDVATPADRLSQEIALLGHRNWLVIADSAYPLQSRPGITTRLADTGQLETVARALDALEQAGHARAKVWLDQEIDHVPEAAAPGIDAYRAELTRILADADADVEKIPHEDLIAKLDEAAQTFNVLILKTDLTIPYTSVFLELDCGYWDAESEAALRQAMGE